MTATESTQSIAETSGRLQTLLDFSANLRLEQLAPEILQTAKACLLYGLAVGVGTRRARPAELATAASRVAQSGDDGPATRLHDGARTSCGNAAFANAVLLSGRVQGDSHPCGHLGGVIIPSALAAIEETGGAGGELLMALVAGYETALRIGRDHSADLNKTGFRTTPCYGVLGATVAIARARKMDAARFRNCIGMAVNFAAGLREYVDAGTEESPFQAGFAARNATHVADLVGLGLGASPTGLFGPAGFYKVFGNASRNDYDTRMVDALGKQFEFTTVTVKRYPACQFVRAIIRGLAALRSQAEGQHPERIVLRLNPFEANFIGMRYAGPFSSAVQTVMSAPFCAALAWLHGSVTYSGLRIFDDAATNALARRVEVVADDSRALYEPVVTVVLEDGRVMEWTERAELSDDRMSWDAAVEMTHSLYHEVGVPKSMAEDLIIRVAEIDRSPSVDRLVHEVCRATRYES